MDILDKAQAKFCNENAAQVLQLNERMQEAKKLLSSVQVMFDKTEDINFMKVRCNSYIETVGESVIVGTFKRYMWPFTCAIARRLRFCKVLVLCFKELA